jgi:hypothetical protein
MRRPTAQGLRDRTTEDRKRRRSLRVPRPSYSVAEVVEIRDAYELITDERNRFNKSLATLIREKSPPKIPEAERKTG